jgi:ribonucleoside-diphosphate reductase alpha chain
MGALIMRELLPDRRRNWTKRVRIEGQTIYLCVGEYPDGRPGEIFVDVAKQGTFLRGVMGSLARSLSIALQCGSGIEMVIHSLRGTDYPPSGIVEGSVAVKSCVSVMDWVASELEARYLLPQNSLEEYTVPPEITAPSEVRQERSAGYIPESWRSGV